MSKERAKEAIVRLVEALSQQDATAVAALYSEDARYYAPGQSEPLRGREQIRSDYADFFRAFPDLASELLTVIGAGDEACGEFLTRGTHTGPLASRVGQIAPTGRTFTHKGACFVKVDAKGLIVEDRTYYDTVEFARQLGLGSVG